MIKKNITIDNLVTMIQKGFEETATKSELAGLRSEMATKSQLATLSSDMSRRFDKIEKLLIEEQNRKIEKLESRVEYLENMLNFPKLQRN